MGVDWQLMLPVQPLKGKYQRLDLRNHRKLLVVDGHMAFIGSQNLIDRSYNKKKNIKRGLKWQELMCRLEGPVVGVDRPGLRDRLVHRVGRGLPTASRPRPSATPPRAARWTARWCPSGPGFEVENNLQLFLSLLYGARERIIITSPYFVPDDSMLRGLMAATARGVHVDLFVSEIGDQALVWHAQRSYYEALLGAGVRIYCYPAPYILHAKHFSVDDEVALIGSSNMDMRSFGLNSEISLMVRSTLVRAEMRAVEADYRELSTELTLGVGAGAAADHRVRRAGPADLGAAVVSRAEGPAGRAGTGPGGRTPRRRQTPRAVSRVRSQKRERASSGLSTSSITNTRNVVNAGITYQRLPAVAVTQTTATATATE